MIFAKKECPTCNLVQPVAQELANRGRPVIAPPNGEKSDEFEIFQAEVTNRQSSQIAMDEAFCLRMRAAIAAGLESATIGVVTTPGTKYPRHVPSEPRPLVSSQREVEHA